MNVVDTFSFVIARSARNRVVHQVKRLKQPRYLIAFLLGLGYWWLYFGRNVVEVRGGGRLPLEYVPAASAGFCLFGLLLLLGAWVFGSRQSTLTFSEAEIQFFFPAPASRRALLNYKLLKSMLLGLLTTAFFTLVFGRAAVGSQAFFAVGLWLAVTTLSLHAVAAGRTRQALLEHGATGLRASLPTLAVVAVILGAVGWSAWQARSLPPFQPTRAWLDGALQLVEAPPLGWLLWPIAVFADVLFARDGVAFFGALPGALAVVGLHYLWVIAGDAPFEESSVRAAEARAKAVESRQAGGARPARGKSREPPFALGSSGPPEVALIWKGMIASGRFFNVRMLVVVAPMLVLAVVMGAAVEDLATGLSFAGMFLLLFWLMSTLAGGALSRADLRRDLDYLEVLRALPLAGRQVVIGEALGALAPAVVVQWALLALGLGLVQGDAVVELDLSEKLAVGLALGLFGPAVTLAGILVQNAAVIFVPGWVGNPRGGAQGPEASGLAMLVLLGNLLAVSLGLVPALLFGALLGFAVLPLLGLGALVVGAAGASFVALVEAWLAAAVLGKAFETFEPGT